MISEKAISSLSTRTPVLRPIRLARKGLQVSVIGQLVRMLAYDWSKVRMEASDWPKSPVSTARLFRTGPKKIRQFSFLFWSSASCFFRI